MYVEVKTSKDGEVQFEHEGRNLCVIHEGDGEKFYVCLFNTTDFSEGARMLQVLIEAFFSYTRNVNYEETQSVSMSDLLARMNVGQVLNTIAQDLLLPPDQSGYGESKELPLLGGEEVRN